VFELSNFSCHGKQVSLLKEKNEMLAQELHEAKRFGQDLADFVAEEGLKPVSFGNNSRRSSRSNNNNNNDEEGSETSSTNRNRNVTVSATFGAGPLGLTVATSTLSGNLLVIKATGQADHNGILVGDKVESVNGTSCLGASSSEFKHLVAAAGRPLVLTVTRYDEGVDFCSKVISRDYFHFLCVCFFKYNFIGFLLKKLKTSREL
jgi:hypothetical protein